MWSYLIALSLEILLIAVLLSQYARRRSRRIKSDKIKLAQEHYKTEKFQADLNEIRAQRDLVKELKEMFK